MVIRPLICADIFISFIYPENFPLNVHKELCNLFLNINNYNKRKIIKLLS